MALPFALSLLLLLLPPPSSAQAPPQYLITTVAGNGSASFGGDGDPFSGGIGGPTGVSIHPGVGVLITDPGSNRVRLLANGVLTTVAGTGVPEYCCDFAGLGDGGAATLAKLSHPAGVLWDPRGRMFVSQGDSFYNSGPGGNRVRVVEDGTISTFAGTGLTSGDGVGGLATSATLYSPHGLTMGGDGTLYISDTKYMRVLSVSPTDGILREVAGTHVGQPGPVFGGYSGDGGLALNAMMNYPAGVAVSGTLIYIADSWNHRIRVVNVGTLPATALTVSVPRLSITTVAGSGCTTTTGTNPCNHYTDGDEGPATSALFTYPLGVAVDAQGNLLFTADHMVRFVTASTGVVHALAGNRQTLGGFRGDGGAATLALMESPSGIAVDASGGVWVCDEGNNRIRLLTPCVGVCSTSPTGLPTPSRSPAPTQGGTHWPEYWVTSGVGNGGAAWSGDGGLGPAAALNFPNAVLAITGAAYGLHQPGDVYIADTKNHRVRYLSRDGVVTTLAGTGVAPGEGTLSVPIPPGLGDGGPASAAQVDSPAGLALDDRGNLFVSESGGHRVRRIDVGDSTISTVAGKGYIGFSGDGFAATSAAVWQPRGLAVSGGTLYIAACNNVRVRAVTQGIISTVAGGGTSTSDGPATSAKMICPSGLALAGTTTLYVADMGGRIYSLNLGSGMMTTVAGDGARGWAGDGGGALASSLFRPASIAVDWQGQFLIIADAGNNVLRLVDLTLMLITTVAGVGEPGGDVAKLGGWNGDGAGNVTLFAEPMGVAAAAVGWWVADSGNHRVRLLCTSDCTPPTPSGTPPSSPSRPASVSSRSTPSASLPARTGSPSSSVTPAATSPAASSTGTTIVSGTSSGTGVPPTPSGSGSGSGSTSNSNSASPSASVSVNPSVSPLPSPSSSRNAQPLGAAGAAPQGALSDGGKVAVGIVVVVAVVVGSVLFVIVRRRKSAALSRSAVGKQSGSEWAGTRSNNPLRPVA